MATSLIVLPPLSSWIKGKIDALYKATKEEEFDEVYHSFVAKAARIMFNGRDVSYEEYREKLANGGFPRSSATVKINEAVITGVLGHQLTQTEGVTGLSITASATRKNADGKTVHSNTASSFNAYVNDDDSLRVPPPPQFKGIHGYHDYRRAFKINHISETHTVVE